MIDAAAIVNEVVYLHRSDKDGEALLDELERLYLAQDGSVQGAVAEVFRNWLKEGDVIKAAWSIELFSRLLMLEELSLMESILRNVREGNANLPKYYEQFLEPAIRRLQDAKDDKERR